MSPDQPAEDQAEVFPWISTLFPPGETSPSVHQPTLPEKPPLSSVHISYGRLGAAGGSRIPYGIRLG
jgi:hypothetical protein